MRFTKPQGTVEMYFLKEAKEKGEVGLLDEMVARESSSTAPGEMICRDYLLCFHSLPLLSHSHTHTAHNKLHPLFFLFSFRFNLTHAHYALCFYLLAYILEIKERRENKITQFFPTHTPVLLTLNP